MAFVISRASPIGELVLNHPVAAAVLLEHGFHCIGCGLAAYETLEEGAAAHGFDDAAIDALVLEIQEAAKKEEEVMKNYAAPPQAAKAAEKQAAEQSSEKKKKKESKTG